MADITDVALNVGGWVIAGLTTALGVVLAYRLERCARNRDEDLHEVYFPLRSQVQQIVDGERNVASGPVWSGPHEEFEKIRRSGILKLKRHEALEREVGELRDLLLANDNAFEELRKKSGPPGTKLDADSGALKTTGEALVRHARAMLSRIDDAIRKRAQY
jgi:hypothetical protein